MLIAKQICTRWNLRNLNDMRRREKIRMRHFWFRKILFSFRPIVLFSITPLVHLFSIIPFSLLFYLLVYLHPFSVILAKIVLHVPVKSWKYVLHTNVHHIACHRIASIMSCLVAPLIPRGLLIFYHTWRITL